MKKLIINLSASIVLAGSCFPALAADFEEIAETLIAAPLLTASTVVSPYVSVMCLARPGYARAYADSCQYAISFGPTSTSSAVLLLKQVEAAQPDALNYMTGAAPSPLLYDTVEKLQTFYAERFNIEMSFNEVINDMMKQI